MKIIKVRKSKTWFEVKVKVDGRKRALSITRVYAVWVFEALREIETPETDDIITITIKRGQDR